MPEEYGLCLKKSYVLVIGMNDTMTTNVHKYIARFIPISVNRSSVLNQKPFFKFGEIIDRQSNIQIEKIPLFNKDRGSWLLKRAGDKRFSFIAFTHKDFSNPNNNDGKIFEDIIAQTNSFIIIVDYNDKQHDKIEMYLESLSQNYLSIFSTSLSTYEQLAPILLLISIKDVKYTDTAVIAIRNIFGKILKRDKNRKLFSNRYIYYQTFNSNISNDSNEGINYGVNLLCRTLDKIHMEE